MIVEMLRTTPDYHAGALVPVSEAEADELISTHVARRAFVQYPHVAEERPTIKRFYEQVAIGAGQPCLFLPTTAEFGHKICTRIRWVHFHKATHKVVCCLPHEKVLYPSANAFFTDWLDEVKDVNRAGSMPNMAWPEIEMMFPDHLPIQTGGLNQEEELIAIEPLKRIPFRPKHRGLNADVVMGIRSRMFMHEKNWPSRFWQFVADVLLDEGYTFAVAGRNDSSISLESMSFHTGDYNDTDASIEAINNCRVYLGTDTGISHLASTIGAHMVVFRCPEKLGGGRSWMNRMRETNPDRITFLPEGWEKPQQVADAVLHALAQRST